MFTYKRWFHIIAGMCCVFVFQSSSRANPIVTATSLRYALPTTACDGLSTGMFADVTANWRSAMDGHVGVTVSADDGTIFWNEMTDPIFGGADNVNGNLDSSDIAFLGTHGGVNLTPTSCYTTPSASCTPTDFKAQLTTTSSDPQGDCLAWDTEEQLGSHNAEYFDSFACNSLEKRGFGYQNYAAAGLHQWHGYSGTTASGSGTSDKSDDYVDDAFDGSASWAWVDNMTDYDHWSPGGADCCATTRVWGTSDADAFDRVAYEQYGLGGWTDANTSFWVFTFITDCDPPSPIPGPIVNW